jgi:hypothetical protein
VASLCNVSLNNIESILAAMWHDEEEPIEDPLAAPEFLFWWGNCIYNWAF